MRWSVKILLAAVALLLASGTLALLAVERDSRGLAIAAMAVMAVAAICFLVALRRPRRVDWGRIETEQRLWESGPLGRRWLKIRQRLEDRRQ